MRDYFPCKFVNPVGTDLVNYFFENMNHEGPTDRIDFKIFQSCREEPRELFFIS